MSEGREVYDDHTAMNYRWRARVIEGGGSKRKPWRVEFDCHFMGWKPDRPYHWPWRNFRTKDEAAVYANRALDWIESGGSSRGEVVGRV